MALAIATAPDRSAVTSPWQQLRIFLAEELKPAPGKLRAAFIRVAGVVLAMCMAYALNLPEISAVVSLAFFGSSANPAETKKVALGVPPLVLVIFLVLSLVLNIFSTAPLVRIICFIVVVFGSLFMLQAAREGQVFLLAGIFGKVFLELWDSGYPAFLTQELSFWIVVDLGLAGLCALFVCSLFGTPSPDPAKAFRTELASRFELVAGFLDQPDPEEKDWQRLRSETFSAQDQLMTALDAACKKDKAVKDRRTLFTNLVQINQLLLHECVVLYTIFNEAWQSSPDAFLWSGARCRAIAEMVRTGNLIVAPSGPAMGSGNRFATQLVASVKFAQEVAAGRANLPTQTIEKKKKFFRADAFTNPHYFANAARAFAAAFACYCLISGAHWSGIGTAVTTCLITALTTVEQSRQKQSLRIAGAAVGGIVTLFVLIVVIPSGVGLTGLVVVTALVTFISGWIFAGGPNLNYAGVQLALCYYLAIFGENKTPTSLTTVRDRVVGIFIGNLAMWLFYDRIRPAWTIHSARRSFAQEAESIARLVSEQHPATPQDTLEVITREREAFAKAQAELSAMSDTMNPAFSPWAKAQQRDAPEIRYAEAQFNFLFSLEFVQAASAVLGLPEVSPDGHPNVGRPLLGLAKKLRNGEAIEQLRSGVYSQQTSSAEVLLYNTQNALANLFSASRRN